HSPALDPNGQIVFGGSSSNPTVTSMPATKHSSSATITVTVGGGAMSSNDTFVLTVTPDNDAPTISNIPDRTINQDTSTGPINFTVGDAETEASSMTVTGTSSNPALVPEVSIALGGSG